MSYAVVHRRRAVVEQYGNIIVVPRWHGFGRQLVRILFDNADCSAGIHDCRVEIGFVVGVFLVQCGVFGRGYREIVIFAGRCRRFLAQFVHLCQNTVEAVGVEYLQIPDSQLVEAGRDFRFVAVERFEKAYGCVKIFVSLFDTADCNFRVACYLIEIGFDNSVRALLDIVQCGIKHDHFFVQLFLLSHADGNVAVEPGDVGSVQFFPVLFGIGQNLVLHQLCFFICRKRIVEYD